MERRSCQARNCLGCLLTDSTARFLAELFQKMPPHVLPAAAGFVARFALSISEPQRASDAFVLVQRARIAAPELMRDRLWTPLLEEASDDARYLAGARRLRAPLFQKRLGRRRAGAACALQNMS